LLGIGKLHNSRIPCNGRYLPFLLLIGIILSSAALAEEADEIIVKIQRKFESLTALICRFEVSYYAFGSDHIQQETGRLYLDGQGKFRTETEHQTIISDGTSVWMYDVLQNQLLIRRSEESQHDLVTPQRLFYEYPKLYKTERVEEDSFTGIPCHVLVMKPKSETDPTRMLKVWVDKKDYLTRKFFVEDLADNITTFEFEQFEIGSDLPEDVFRFQTPPEGVEVIDLR
jgi:outer membrane lipoprotein-sorting protein